MISSQQSFGFRVSRQQERIWRARTQDEGPICGRIRVDGPIDPIRLRERLCRLVSRHEILRTRIELLPGTTQPIQIIESLPVEIDIHDFSAVARKDRAPVLTGVEKRASVTQLDGNPLHMEIIRFSDTLHFVIIAVSPLCSDVVGLQNIVRELVTSHDDANEAVVVASEQLQYADYSAWQEELLSVDEDAGIRYWRLRRDSHSTPTRLPLEDPIEGASPFEQKCVVSRLSRALVEAVSKLAERSAVSPATVLLGVWIALLHRHAEGQDVSLRYRSEGRSGPMAQAIGAYSLDLPLTVRVASHEEFAQFLRRLQAILDEDREWLDYAAIVDSGAGGRLVWPLGFEYTSAMAPVRAGPVSMRLEAATMPTPPFSLSLQCLSEKDRLEVKFHYDSMRLATAAVERLSMQWSTLLEDASRCPATKISQLELMSAVERERATSELQRSIRTAPLEATGLHTLFERQARLAPDKPALTCGDETWTYAELNRRSAALAARLSARGVGTEDRLGLAIRNPLWMVTAIFAVLKVGGAYVPLDPDHPTERLSFILEDASVVLLLIDSSSAESAYSWQTPCFDLDGGVIAELDVEVRGSPHEERGTGVDARQLAYLIYTSGSIGRPKGVGVSHGAAIHSTMARHSYYIEPVHGFLLLSSFTFDSSVAGLFWTLSQGGRLCLPTMAESRDVEALARLVERHRLSHLLCLPSLYSVLVEHKSARLDTLRSVIVAGESCPPRLPGVHHEHLPHARLYNEYGPTEGTVWSTVAEISSGRSRRIVTIGSPVSGVQMAVLDQRGELVSQGLGGELCIGGAGLARGYLGRPDLTAERFVPNPFGAAGERLYRTGDLGRHCADGSIEFLGRTDHQVKIRGFRIELGEIEAALVRLPRVGDAVVAPRQGRDGETYLTAYATGHNGAELDAAELQTALERELPDYMIPTAFVVLDTLPLTLHGKVDRNALPAPDLDKQNAHRHVEPRTLAETALCRLFAMALGLERVGVEDDFFELGGHSLLAMSLVETLRQHGWRTDVHTLFSNPTPSALAAAIGDGDGVAVPPNLIPLGCDAISPEMLTLATLSPADVDRIVASVPGGAANVQDIYPLAPLQEGILFHHLIASEGDPYLTPVLLSFDTRARVDAFVGALQSVIARHDILRTAIVWEGLPEPMQVVWRDAPLIVEDISLDPVDGDVGEQLRRRFDPRKLRIDIRQAPMLRGFLAHDAATQRWMLLILFHHLVSDHTTLEVVVKEARAHLQGETGELLAPTPFRHFIAQARLGVGRAEHEAFFREMLGDVDEPTAPFDLLDARGDGSAIAEGRLALDAALARRIRERARALAVSPASLCHQAFAQLLGRASGRDDVVFGTVLFGRMHGAEGVADTVGLFINTLPLRIRLGVEGVGDAVRRTHELLIDLLRHEHASLALAQHCSGVVAPAPLFSALLNYRHSSAREATPAERTGEWEGIESFHAEERTNYPLVLSVDDLGEGFALTAQTQRPLDPERICNYMRVVLEHLVDALEQAPQTPTRTIDILPQDERHRLLIEWNDTAVDYPKDRCIHELFEEQAARAPDAVALVLEGAQLSYGELNERANRLAHRLRSLGVGPETIVGLCVERSFEMIIGLLGVLKAGGAYLPIDPDYPLDRIAFMIDDAAPALILTQDHLRERLPETIATLRLDADWPKIAAESAENPAPRATPHNLAYVIYTSGSTGRPKGVGVVHRGVVRLSKSQDYARFDNPEEAVLHCAPLAFDASTFEIWGALLNCARLIIAPPSALSALEDIGRLVKEYRVTTLWLTAALFDAMVDGHLQDLCNVELLLTGGDVVSPRHARMFCDAFPSNMLINGYGPTENTTFSTFYVIPRSKKQDPLPIGKPIRNSRAFVLDSRVQLVPIGVAGELYIGGAGLARGYVGRPDLTAERFVPNPFGEAGERLYRTGDLARYREDGNIEFLGRIDHQVKIRGFRIELGEIEAVLARLPQMRDAVVLARDDLAGDKRLVAYVVATEGGALDTGELREALARELPDYMIPSAFVALDALPLTANGKIDRKALPAPDIEAELARRYVAPRNATEAALCRIFAETLGLERVGVEDNFFELGGHSLLAVQIVSRIWREFEWQLPLRGLFESPRIAALAARICGDAEEAALPEIRPISREGALPLSFAQQRLWFLDQLQPGAATYNIATALRVIGDFDMAGFAFAVNEIVRRHEALRTTFVVQNGVAAQVIAPSLEIATPLVDLGALDEELRETEALRLAGEEARRPFDLARDPLLRVATLDLGTRAATGERERIVLFTLHHIVSDGWSSGVLIGEFVALYEAFAAGRPSPLAELTIQYADYALWQREWLQGEVLERQLAYWRDRLADAPAALDLPTDRPRPARQDHVGATHYFKVDKDIADGLARIARGEGATLFMTLLAAFQLLLSRYNGQRDISVGTPVANRRRIELEQMIGFFVNTLVMRTDLSGDPSFRALLARVRETALGAQAHQDLPFERLVEELQPIRDMSRDPLFQVMFVLQNAPKSDATLGGLRFEPVAAEGASAKFDLTLSMDETESGLSASLNYATALFDAGTIERMARHYCALLAAVVADPDRRIGELNMLDASERHRLLVEWNDTAVDYPKDRCIHELFEEQAARAPDAVVLVFEGAQLSYGALNARANRLAHRLRARGVGPETIVGLCVERSFEMIIGLLGVLKAGGAYLPIDPDYPRDRIAFMIDDAAPALILTQDHLRDRLPEVIATLRLDADWPKIAAESTENPAPRATSDNLAYVIYTSGSTGRPKGVGVAHAGVPNLAFEQRDRFAIFDHSRVLQFANATFDAAVSEIAMALTSGACLVLARADQRAGERLAEILADEHITHVTLPPAVLPSLASSFETGLECLVVAGEAFSAELAKRWAGDRRLINAYGPTEATVCATLSEPLRPGEEPSIGRPIANTQIYLLDPGSAPVPVGVAGELYIGGAGLARGYVGRPDLTAERFVPNPFGEAGERLYRTGDLARYREDGNIEFLGRVDHQVKIRGFRIELGEIEAALARRPQIRDAVVLAREDRTGDKRLVAYAVAADGASLDSAELRAALERALPDHMIPSVFIALDALPLTANGKIDRSALPTSDREAQIDVTYVGPRTVSEYVLVREFCAVLRRERIGVHDDFFRLGGNSLSGVKLVDRIRRCLYSDLPVTALFQAPTIAQLAAWISGADHHKRSPLVMMRSGGAAAASPLYCIHPSGGSIICYQPLADAMPGARAIYGVQSRNLIDPTHISGSFDEMARDYADLLRRHQPNGPYLLLGWSTGGHVAVKMTELLELEGQTVSFLGILDSAFASKERRRSEVVGPQRSTALDHLTLFAATEGIDIENRLGPSDREHLAAISSQLDARELFVYAAMWGQERGFWTNISVELMNFLYTDKAVSARLMSELVLNPVRAPIHIWWSQRSLERAGGVPFDWRELTSGEVHTEVVGGDHETIVRDPLVHERIIRALEGSKI